MIIKTLRFKNFKSYGNKLQEITFDSNGGLTLLSGGNGSGKSSIIESVNLVLYNQVNGKHNNRIPIKSLPNRTNKNLEVYIEFINFREDLIKISRKVEPNDFSININNQDFTERFKLLNEDERENIIGFNYQTFRSFVSLSMNDFLNFIDLKPEDKRNLLNRLFNLERIDDYLSITKEIYLQNKKDIERLILENNSTDKELKNLQEIIKNNSGKTKLTEDEFKKMISDVKIKYEKVQYEITDLSNKISDFQVNMQQYKNDININNNENIRRKTEIIDIRNKIKIFESGKCPYCSSELDDDEHTLMLNDLKVNEVSLSEIITTNDKKINYLMDENKSIGQQVRLLEDTKNILTNELSDIKSDARIIKKEYEEYKNSDNRIVDDLKLKGKTLISERNEKKERIQLLKKDNEELNELSKILGDQGARKSIISSIIPPINHYLTKLLDSINYPYNVVLNDNFDAIISDKGESINNETPSNGEIRMLNICIAISYIQMVRKIKNINILFMDEVFQSVTKENINLLLDLLKTFALENDLHLILVNHGLEEVDPKYFNKIISVEKDIFSDFKIN